MQTYTRLRNSASWWYPPLRRKRIQAMRSASCRVVGSQWNRTCLLRTVCEGSAFCFCCMPRVERLRHRSAVRTATCFLKWANFDEKPTVFPVKQRLAIQVCGMIAANRQWNIKAWQPL